MLSASREDRKAYIRESANTLASISSLPLTSETAHTLTEKFRGITLASERIGADLYLQLLASCRDLCTAGEQNRFNEKEATQANEILKEAVVGIQTSLFSVALFGDVEKDRPRLNELTTRIQQFLRNGKFILPDGEESKTFAIAPSPLQPSQALGSAGHAPMSQQEIIETLAGQPDHLKSSDSAERPSFGAAVMTVADSAPPPKVDAAGRMQILGLIEKLVVKSWPTGMLEAEAVELSRVARQSYGIAFSQICDRISAETGFEIGCETPDFPIETQHARLLLDQFRYWLRTQQLTYTVIDARARQLGRTVGVELRLKDRFVMSPELLNGCTHGANRSPRLSELSGNPEHSYLNTDGHLVQRTCFDLSLSLFEACRIQCGADAFLVAPDCLVEDPGDSPTRLGAGLLPEISGPLALSDPSARKTIHLRWREKVVTIEVDELSESRHYLCKKASLPGASAQAIVGMAWDCGPLWVLDTDLWLDLILMDKPESISPKPVVTSQSGSWSVFKVAHLHFGVPPGCVAESGELSGRELPGGFIETEHGVARLRDFRELAGLPGSLGRKFLLLSTSEGILAFGVDEVEGVLELNVENGHALHPVNRAPIVIVDPGKLLRAKDKRIAA